jgi:hypothetical protein
MKAEIKYPICIVSKGRSDSMLTSRSLADLAIEHYIAIEPQDEHNYEVAIDKFNLRKYVTLLILPFSNHGDGPGRARNYWWKYAKEVLNSDRHWVMDDNIRNFVRYNNNKRSKITNPTEAKMMFRSCEDFVDRYENVAMAGLNYDFFCVPKENRPPYIPNTRIYSCNLIDNDCKHQWRGRYNEDTILSLDILKDGLCTIQFNHLLQAKCATQTLKGGNTDEFYHSEGNLNKKKWRDGNMNPTGTYNKSKMLVDTHPDVAKLVWMYERWHHKVDYRPFKKNRLIYKNEYKSMAA